MASGVDIGAVSDWREFMSQSGSCSDAGVAFDTESSDHPRVVVVSKSESVMIEVSVVVGLFLIQSGMPSSESVVVGIGAMVTGSGVLISNSGDIESIGCANGLDSIRGFSISILDGALSQSGTLSAITGDTSIGVSLITGVTVMSGSTGGTIGVTIGGVGV